MYLNDPVLNIPEEERNAAAIRTVIVSVVQQVKLLQLKTSILIILFILLALEQK